MDTLEKAADQVARDFLKADSRKVPVWDVTITRNAILDVLGSSTEPDFIAKICACRLVGWDARRVIDRIAPHLLNLCGKTVQEARAWT